MWNLNYLTYNQPQAKNVRIAGEFGILPKELIEKLETPNNYVTISILRENY